MNGYVKIDNEVSDLPKGRLRGRIVAMEWFTRQYIGTRKTQQDSVRVCMTENGLLAAVCDGMGSLPRSAEASAFVADFVSDGYKALGSGADISLFLKEAVRDADEETADRFDGTGGTTGVFAHIGENGLGWFSVGDSRLYIFRGGVLTRLTRDHNYRYVLDQRLAGELITREKYEAECSRGGALVSYIGMDGLYLTDMSARPLGLCAGDMLLLTSDGLYRALGENVIASVLAKHCASSGADTEAASDELIHRVMAVTGCHIDNTSFVLIGY